MRWYSIKKYIPPMEVICFIFTENNYIYAAKLIDSGSSDIWAIENTTEEGGTYTEKIYGITHFCIPEPIEIE